MKVLARVIAMVVTVVGFSAIASGVSFGSKSKALRGEFIFQVAGALDFNSITALGLLAFAMDGNASGTVTFSLGAPTLVAGENCTFSLRTASAVTVSNGVSSMVLSFCPGGGCTTDGTLSFNFIVQRGAQEARLMLTGFSPAVPSTSPNGICGFALTSFTDLTLAGDLAKQ